MSFFREVDLGDRFGPFVLFRERFGFVPNLFRAQTLAPRAIEAEGGIAHRILLTDGALSRIQKECILLAVAAGNESTYCLTAHSHMLRSMGLEDQSVRQVAIDHHRAGLPADDAALLDFGVKLSRRPTSIGSGDFAELRRCGFGDEAILETILVAALADFLCTLAVGLGAEPDFEPVAAGPARAAPPGLSAGHPPAHAHGARPGPGIYLRSVDLTPDSFPPFAFFRERFGFVPNIFRAQTLRPDVIGAETEAVRVVLLSEEVLPRARKELLLLAVSAANLNTYCVAVHAELLRGLGVPAEVSEQIAQDHHASALPDADKALLDFALTLARRPRDFSVRDIDSLLGQGFSEEQALEAVIMTALTRFLNTLQMGVGSVPEAGVRPVAPAPASQARDLNLSVAPDRPMRSAAGGDPDGVLVSGAQAGERGAFGELFARHGRRVYRILLGTTGNPEDAEDGMQNVFIKVLQKIGTFQGESRFSTWVTRIALNEGIERLRGRKDHESLDDNDLDDEEITPRSLRAWMDSPEEAFSRAELRDLVEREILRLPARYRLPLLLRDLEQIDTQEAAAALGLSVPTLKTRLLRGRLMLREALAPHFAARTVGA